MLYGIVLLTAGLLACYVVFISSGQTETILNIEKYGGLAVAGLGLFGLVASLLSTELVSGALVGWLMKLVVSVALATLGILLFLKPRLTEPMTEFTGTMSIISVGLGIAQIVVSLIW